MNNKREAREFCLQFLYHYHLPAFQSDKLNLETSEIFRKLQEFKETLNLDLHPDAQAYVTTMVKGILKQHEDLEQTLTNYLKNWKLSRLSKIEHTILIMGIYELKHHPEVPAKVVINECIELGKKYSSKDSGSFINGILDSYLKKELQKNG